MKSSILYFIILVILMLVISPFAPWWIVFILPLILSLGFDQSIIKALICSFLAGFIIWIGMHFYSGSGNSHALSINMGNLFGGISYPILYLVAGLLGGIYGGLGGFLGQAIKNFLRSKQSGA